MLRRIVAVVMALAIAIPPVQLALPDLFKIPAFKSYIKFDAKRQVFTETLALMDNWCRTLRWADENMHRHCWVPKDIQPERRIVLRTDLYTAQSGEQKRASVRRSAKANPLGLADTARVDIAAYDPHSFYERWRPPDKKNTQGLRVWESFLKGVLPYLGQTPSGVRAVALYDLEDRAYDRELKRRLPTNHEWELDEACAVIASLCRAQRGGQTGVLLTRGTNVFYTGALAIILAWSGEDFGWSVGAWQLSRSNVWNRGDRFFVPA